MTTPEAKNQDSCRVSAFNVFELVAGLVSRQRRRGTKKNQERAEPFSETAAPVLRGRRTE